MLTISSITAAANDEELIDLLGKEIQRRLPSEVQEDRETYFEHLSTVPRGLRAMAGIHFFDVSMSLDDLAWHFLNQNDPRDVAETYNGLRELGLPRIAEMFQQAWFLLGRVHAIS